MEHLVMEDDICILNHETAYSPAESPASVGPGDESMASRFALVMAYEDIKKRLRETEKENVLLRRKVKQLEDKLYLPEEPTSEGQQYVNKAFSAYRGIYIEKKDLQIELNRLKKEKSESEKILNEQLQAKELELLQLRTEMETSQVMKSLNSGKDYWEVDKMNCELKIQTLQQELEKVTLQYRSLQALCKEPGSSSLKQDKEPNAEHGAFLHSYTELRQTLSQLQVASKQQTEALQKIRDRPPCPGRRAASTIPVQCLDDVERNKRTGRGTASRPPSAPPVPSCSGRPCPPTGLSPFLQSTPPLSGASLEDSSWSIPSSPKPNDALFWESGSPKSDTLKPF